MRPFRGALWVCALALWAGEGNSLHAAWCNVFQVCCKSCGGRSSANYGSYSYYAPPPAAGPCCTPCPQQVCTTQYVQRCYYQPVTSYQTQTYYEPVTTYRTSFYLEPVVSYRVSNYCDPCTGCCRQVSCPVTSYRWRSQCCPVQSWVQRCCSVPVTSYRTVTYYEPVTSCCSTPAPACCGSAAPAPVAAPAPPPVSPPGDAMPYAGNPGVTEQRSGPVTPPMQPRVNEYRNGGGSSDSYQGAGAMPQKSTGSYYRQSPYRSTPAPSVPVRPERITSADHNVEGQIVRDNQVPQGGARLFFASVEHSGTHREAVADANGCFRVTLASGGWSVYTRDNSGKLVFHTDIKVQEQALRQVRLVSR